MPACPHRPPNTHPYSRSKNAATKAKTKPRYAANVTRLNFHQETDEETTRMASLVTPNAMAKKSVVSISVAAPSQPAKIQATKPVIGSTTPAKCRSCTEADASNSPNDSCAGVEPSAKAMRAVCAPNHSTKNQYLETAQLSWSNERIGTRCTSTARYTPPRGSLCKEGFWKHRRIQRRAGGCVRKGGAASGRIDREQSGTKQRTKDPGRHWGKLLKEGVASNTRVKHCEE